jgi:hypothetical protein
MTAGISGFVRGSSRGMGRPEGRRTASTFGGGGTSLLPTIFLPTSFSGTNDLTIGSRIRYLSGIPKNALGAHSVYGPDESFLLPRGAMGRSEYEHGVDVHLAYGRKISKTMIAEVYFDVFNLYNKQGTFDTDQTYAPAVRLSSAQGGGSSENNVNPIVGGQYEDLIWAKTIDSQGNETAVPTARNPNFGRTASRYAPTSARIGFRLTF